MIWTRDGLKCLCLVMADRVILQGLAPAVAEDLYMLIKKVCANSRLRD
jgi:hypothetical protein